MRPSAASAACGQVNKRFFMSARYLVLLLICGAIAFQCVYYHPLLPEQVASRFGAGGQPNGWTTREGFFVFYTVIFTVMAFSFFVLPLLLHRFRVTAINIPNRNYWLRPQNREQAYTMLTHEMAWFGNAIFGFLFYVMQLVFEANVAEQGVQRRLPEGQFLALLGIFFAFVIFWTVRLYRRFAVPTGGSGTQRRMLQ
jgi:uncharacterized membrane protein